jgi:hypothetical protein
MLLTYLMLFVALCLSAVAAFYSIIGLTAIFAAAVWPIVIMGTILEAAKLVVTVWLHEYWREVKLSMKLYLVPAVFTLMVITSMGIFGFLSKAHLDQTVPTGDVQAQVALIDEKITNERDTIANARTLLGQLDRAVSDLAAAGDREVKNRDGSVTTVTAAERSLQVRRQQARDRAALTKTIEEAQARIVKLQEEKAPFAKDLRKIEAEVGPVKYIAALIYGDNPDANLLEKAVRWVIIILVAVFDPLAIMMLLAFTESYRWERQRREEKNADNISTVVDDDGSRTEDIPGHLAGDDLADQPVVVADRPEKLVPYKILDDVSEPDYPDLPLPTSALSDQPVDDDDDDDENDHLKEAKRIWKEQNPGETLKEQRRLLAAGMIDRLPWEDLVQEISLDKDVGETGFGEEFPVSPVRGQMWIKTTELPTRLYKFNGSKWIEVDKTKTDHYSYNQSYINHLIARISAGQYDPELLTDSERSQIEQQLKQNIE